MQPRTQGPWLHPPRRASQSRPRAFWIVLALTVGLVLCHLSDAPARARADIRAVYGVTP